MVCKGIRRNATPFVCTPYLRHYAKPFHATLHGLNVCCAIRHYAEPSHCLCVRCAIRHYAEPFHATLHRLYVRCAIRHYRQSFTQRYTQRYAILQLIHRPALYLLTCLTSFFFCGEGHPYRRGMNWNQLKYELQPTELWEILTNFKLLSSC